MEIRISQITVGPVWLAWSRSLITVWKLWMLVVPHKYMLNLKPESDEAWKKKVFMYNNAIIILILVEFQQLFMFNPVTEFIWETWCINQLLSPENFLKQTTGRNYFNTSFWNKSIPIMIAHSLKISFLYFPSFHKLTGIRNNKYKSYLCYSFQSFDLSNLFAWN